MFGRGAWLLAGVVAVTGMLVLGPSTPVGLPFARTVPADAAKDVVPNRVMTWNLCNPCDQDNVDRAAEIARYAPQIVGLQEACVRDVERIRDHLANLHGLVYHVEYGPVLRNWSRCGGAPWKPGGYGQALLSAAPMTDVVLEEYPHGGSEDRGYLAVSTEVAGQPVRVFNTHLAQRRQESVREEQIRVLAPQVARYDRAIVLGDFNAVPESPELAPMWALAEDTDAGCRPSSAGDCEATTDWQSKFDYVFLRGLSALGHEVLDSAYSDHHLLHTDVTAS